MANLKLTNLASYKAYFANIALKHKEIDGFKWGDLDVVKNDNRSDIVSRFLWAKPYDNFRYSGEDNIIKIKPAVVGFFIVPASHGFSDIETAYDFCESVMEDVVAKLYQDKRGSMVGGNWEMLATKISSFKGRPVQEEFGSTKYIGFELTFEFSDNTNLAFNAAKWDA